MRCQEKILSPQTNYLIDGQYAGKPVGYAAFVERQTTLDLLRPGMTE